MKSLVACSAALFFTLACTPKSDEGGGAGSSGSGGKGGSGSGGSSASGGSSGTGGSTASGGSSGTGGSSASGGSSGTGGSSASGGSSGTGGSGTGGSGTGGAAGAGGAGGSVDAGGGETAAPTGTVAVAMMASTGTAAFPALKGTATFTQTGDQVTLVIELEGCKKGPRATHLHDKNDCAQAGNAAGNHWVPNGEGLGDIQCDDAGKAKHTVTRPTSKWTIGDNKEATDVTLHSLMVHEGSDTAQPGTRIACGKVTKQ